MTLAELEKLTNALRSNGGNDDTEVKMLDNKTGNVKEINGFRVWHVTGFPMLVVNDKPVRKA